MHLDPDANIAGLPENARRPLEPGEQYVPVVPDEQVQEVTVRSVVLGLIFCAIFAMAAAYLALKVGQGIEAAIAILAIGLGSFFSRKSTLLENVIIQYIGANSSHVVSGVVFTIPALYMLAADLLSWPSSSWAPRSPPCSAAWPCGCCPKPTWVRASAPPSCRRPRPLS